MAHGRTILRRTLLSAALGAATSLSIAWIIARRTTNLSLVTWFAEPVAPERRGRRSWADWVNAEIVVCEGRGLTWIRLDARSAVESRSTVSIARPGMPVDLRSVPRWAEPIVTPWRAELRRGEPVTVRAGQRIGVLAAGWPLPVVRTVFRDTGLGSLEPEPMAWSFTARTIQAAANVGWTSFVEPVPRIIPLVPLWENLALSTALYGATWAGVLTVFVRLRERRRIRRGLCRQCAYDLRGLSMGAVCPECGRGAARSRDPGET